MKRTLLMMMLFSTTLAMGFPALAEILTLKDPDWQEVPGTEPLNDDSFAAYIEMNGLLRSKSTRVFDMIDPQMYYFRVELDCDTKQHRILRKGTVETKTRLQYEELGGSSWESARDVMREVAVFACSR